MTTPERTHRSLREAFYVLDVAAGHPAHARNYADEFAKAWRDEVESFKEREQAQAQRRRAMDEKEAKIRSGYARALREVVSHLTTYEAHRLRHALAAAKGEEADHLEVVVSSELEAERRPA